MASTPPSRTCACSGSSGRTLTTLAGDAFPSRDLIQFVAFAVTIGTLLVQGLTLPWLIRTLGISDPAEDKYRAAQHAVARDIADAAGRAAITAFRDGQTDPKARAAAEQMLKRASVEDAAERQSHTEHDTMVLELGRTVLEARRAALVAARDERKLDDEVLREIMEEIDLQQAVLANWEPGRFSG